MNRHATDRAYTLVEMMVVLSIILILIALRMPVLSNAAEGGRLAAGLSNMRQLGYANLNYAHDNAKTICDADDFLSVDWRPPFNAPWPNIGSVPSRSVLILGKYLDPDPDVFTCPSDDGTREDRKDITWAYQYIRSGTTFSYTRNACADDYARFVKMSRLPRPAETPLLVEEHELSPMNDGVFYGNAFDFLTQRHFGYIGGMLFYDGHVDAHDSRIYNGQTSWWRARFLNPR